MTSISAIRYDCVSESVFLTVRANVDFEVEISPEALGEIWAEMDSGEQAKFFNYIGTKKWLPDQLSAVASDCELSAEGRRSMQMIGEYGKEAE